MKKTIYLLVIFCILILSFFLIKDFKDIDDILIVTEVLTLNQADFMFKKPFVDNIKFLENGKKIDIDCLPCSVLNKITLLTREVPVFESHSGKVKDIFQVLSLNQTRDPRKHSIGLIQTEEQTKIGMPWIEDLQASEDDLSFSVTNISLLELSIIIAEKENLEYIISKRGDISFVPKKQLKKEQAYVIKRK